MTSPNDRQSGEETPANPVEHIIADLSNLRLSNLDYRSTESSSESSHDSSVHPRRTLADLQDIMTNTGETYEINGVTITVTEEEIEREHETLYTKAKRKTYDAKVVKKELLESIQKHQQEVFKSITISVNDPERMTNTHSIAQLLAENRQNLVKYDLHDVFSIVFPKPNSFNKQHAEYRQLETEIQLAGGTARIPITKDLFTDYLSLTAEQVALSTKWYARFVPKSELMQENLRWSLAYYEQNVEKTLYSKVHAQLLAYPPESRGGPLFLKLLLDRVSTTNEANLKAIIHITETYQIKKSCKGENVETVVELFRALYDNMASLKQGRLPEDAVKNLLQVFQTTSVSTFNDLFEKMEIERLNNEIRSSVDHKFANSTDTHSLGNNMTTVDFILKYAERVYRTFVQKGIWDSVLQRPPGEAAFLGETVNQEQPLGPTQFTPLTDCRTLQSGQPLLPIKPWTDPGDCYNCGNPKCRLSTCKHPKDKLRIRANKEKDPRLQNNKKWRLPEPHENNKRIIDGHPYTFVPTMKPTGRWIRDDTPSDGQPNDGRPPQTQLLQGRSSQSTSSGATSSMSTLTQSRTALVDPVERRLELEMEINRLRAEYDAL